MEAANVLHGITMVDGVSSVVPVELETLPLQEELYGGKDD
jgi:chromosome segregation protein